MNKKLILILICIAVFSINAVSAGEITNETSEVIGEPTGYVPSIDAFDVTKIVLGPEAYEATMYDNFGEPLVNQRVNLEVNGVLYSRVTNNDGFVRMNINLMPGHYEIKASNPATGEYKISSIDILPNIVDNHDLTKFYKNDSQYRARILNSNGNSASSGEAVTFNINGVFYTRYTDNTGHVKLNINLNPGTYIITAEYNGYRTSNTVTVISTLYEYSEYHENIPYDPYQHKMIYREGAFRVVALDSYGNPIHDGAKVTFNINGVFYDRYTSEGGVARLNINLNPGEYIITAEFNGLKISKRLIVIQNPLYYTIKGPINYEFSHTDWVWSPQHDNYIKNIMDIYGNSGIELLNIGIFGEKYIDYDSNTAMVTRYDESGNYISQEYLG